MVGGEGGGRRVKFKDWGVMRGWSLNDINPQNKHKKLISVFNSSTLEEQATAAMDKLVSRRLEG